MTAVNVEVVKNQNETNLSLIRRFSKRLQGSRTLFRARSLRFRARPQSKLKKKEYALKRITKRAETEKLRKLGKLEEK